MQSVPVVQHLSTIQIRINRLELEADPLKGRVIHLQLTNCLAYRNALPPSGRSV